MSRDHDLHQIGLLDDARAYVLKINTDAETMTPDRWSNWELLELLEIALKDLMTERLKDRTTSAGRVRVRVDLGLSLDQHGDALASALARILLQLADRIAKGGESDLVIRDDCDEPIGILMIDGGRP